MMPRLELERLEADTWSLLSQSLLNIGAVKQGDIDCLYYSIPGTPAARLLRIIRIWGSIRFRQGLGVELEN